MRHVACVDVDDDLPETHTLGVSELAWGWAPSSSQQQAGAARVQVHGNNFLTEAAVGHLLRQHVIPHAGRAFCRVEVAWRTCAYGNIAMEHAGTGMDELLGEITLPQMQSALLQVLVGLAWAQHLVEFKHHDLHSGNVFLSRRRVLRELRLPGAERVVLPHVGVQATVADYGLSAATDPCSGMRYVRADYHTLRVDGASWGPWTGDLRGHEGYDVVVLLANLEYECRRRGARRDVCAWVTRALRAVRSLQPSLRISYAHGRPIGETSVSPAALLRHAMFADFLRLE